MTYWYPNLKESFMKDSYILTIDQGTTGTTILLVDRKGKIVDKGYAEITQYYPRPGWVEHDPEEIWQRTITTVESLLRKNNLTKIQIAAIGITNQRETTVVWDKKSGRPVHNAIVWQCRRTADICNQMREAGLSEIIRQKTGLVIDPYFSATKLGWILDNVEGARNLAEKGDVLFGTIDTWLMWKLTGGKIHATDYTNASRTMLFNIHTLKWDDDLLSELNVPKAVLPEVLPSSGKFGKTGFGSTVLDGISIAGDAGDQQSALFGQACFRPGDAKNTYGTGCFLMLNTGNQPVFSKHGLLTTLACNTNNSPVYALEGSIFIAGAAIQWLRDELKIINSASETENFALNVPDTGGVYVVPAFTGLGAPYWDADARGAIIGITRGTKREHIIRATLESIAYQTADVMDVMHMDSGVQIRQLRVDGGAVANNFLMQFQSDILNVEVERPEVNETTAMGASFLAGLSVGFWNNESELEECRKTDTIFKPAISIEQREKLLSGWRKAVHKVMYKG
jgi:glycerol kinase